MSRAIWLAAALSVLVTAAAAPPPQAAARPQAAAGVYRGAHNPAGVADFEHWLGREVSVVLDFIDARSWSTISHPAKLARWDAHPGRPPRYRMVYGVPIIPSSGGSLAEGAAGHYDGYFRSLAQALVRAHQGNAILRLGWEFSGGWYPWSPRSDAEAVLFARYWRRIVSTMRAVSPQFRFDWNPAIGWAPFDIEKAYPGDDFVDTVGVDVYDQSWITDYLDPSARWNDFLTGQWSLDFYSRFAAAHGKRLSVPEWGLTSREDGHGGGDNPFFIEQMHAWMAKNDVAYQIYFDFGAPDGAHELMSGQFPSGATAYRALFGQSLAGT
ncbi:MAG: glycoside hydrolase family 26 protein [Gaiellaceae bacterium]